MISKNVKDQLSMKDFLIITLKLVNDLMIFFLSLTYNIIKSRINIIDKYKKTVLKN